MPVALPYNLRIRNRIVELLESIDGTDGVYNYDLSDSVKVNRPPQVQRDQSWELNVRVMGETKTGEANSSDGNKEDRAVTVRIEIHRQTKGIDTDVDTELLKAQADIEKAMYSDRRLVTVAGATDMTFVESEVPRNELGELLWGRLDITYSVNYKTP